MFKIFKVSNFPAFLRLRWILLLFLSIFTASIIIVISPLLDTIPSLGVTIRRLLEMIVVPLIIGITSAFLIIFFGYNRLLKTLDQIERDKESGELKKFWSSGKYTICYGKYGGLYVDNNAKLERASRPTIESLVLIRQMLRNIHGEDVPIEEVQLTLQSTEKLKEGNIIILGGPLSIKLMEKFSKDLDLPYQYIENGQRSFRMSGDTQSSTFENGQITSDYASVVRIFDSEKNRMILWFSGNYGLGTFASVLYFTKNKSLLSTDNKFLPSNEGYDKKTVLKQFIVKVESIKNNQIDTGHEDITVHAVQTKDDSAKIQKAISRLLLQQPESSL
jgi:hypothetical protein